MKSLVVFSSNKSHNEYPFMDIRWDSVPFVSEMKIYWRGKVFQLKINASRMQFGVRCELSLIYKRKVYKQLMTKWKYLGGTQGDRFPEITSKGHIITIRKWVDYCRLTDEPIDGIVKRATPLVNPFKIIEQSIEINILDHYKGYRAN
jgi:hypothetical protein